MKEAPMLKKILFLIALIFVLQLIPWHSSQAQTILSFSSATGACIDASTYLSQFGITFVAGTPGATAGSAFRVFLYRTTGHEHERFG